MFIGREKELKFLQDKYDEKKGHLIVLYGRRRVGKTETLKEFYNISRIFSTPVHKERTECSLQNFQSKFCERIFQPNNIYLNLLIGRKRFARSSICHMEKRKS